MDLNLLSGPWVGEDDKCHPCPGPKGNINEEPLWYPVEIIMKRM